jgi:3'(2'), 5'-bisphosphate nucleotidase
MSSDVGPLLAEIVEAAAGVILPLWRSNMAVETKADESPVTEADRRGETLIVERLAKAFPGVPVIAEEEVAASGVPTQIASRFFLVDPLDGTKAFVRGDTHYTVNIGLVENGQPVAGAVCAPASGETWFTSGGAALKRKVGESGGRVIRVRPHDPARVLMLCSHTLKPEHADALRTKYGYTDREPMDSSVKFCIIAQGDADIYPRHGTTMEWDIAAGHAVLLAAGGSVTTPEGGPVTYGKAQEGFKNGWFVARGG